MQQIFALLLVFGYMYSLCDSQTIRPRRCNLNNCNRTNVEICAINRQQQCRRFSNECSLESVNCNATLSTVWNRTDTIQCLSLSVNATGLCSCPALRTCSNEMPTEGICVHRDGHACRLFRTECDLIRARCNREIWRNIDIMQCSGFNFNQTRTCICPKSLLCSRNETQLCVQVNANSCRLYNNECDLEGDRCRGERLLDVNNIHCQRFPVGLNATCTCPRLLACQRNVTNICVRNGANRCQLMRNQCDIEQQICEGAVLIPTLSTQCRNIRIGETGNCSCPALSTCSVNRTDICVRTRVGCRLKTNECELERARCLGEVVVPVSSIQCRGFEPGDGRPCTCPRLDTCNRNNTNICVRTNQGCILMRNECELEQAVCEGRNVSRVEGIHCRNFTHNLSRTCFCPNLTTCNRNSSTICVKSSTQCRLVRNECELERAKCEGNNLTKTHATQCFNFHINQQSNCVCPNLLTCSQNSSRICARTRAGCKLLATQCELENAFCRGEALKTLNSIHCQGFRIREERPCLCSNLFNCSKNSTITCVKLPSGRCKLLRNQCDMEYEKCQGQVQTISPLHCLGFTYNQARKCSCPNLKTCSRSNTDICIRTTTGCRLLRDECELEQLRCQGQKVAVLPAVQCRFLSAGNERSCACPNWLSCQHNSSSICVETRGGCKFLRNQCDLQQELCQGRALNVTNILQCQGFTPGTLRSCACPELKTCLQNNSAPICVRNKRNCTLMANSCDLEMAKCRGEKWCPADIEECKNFSVGQQATCSCPRLQYCAQKNKTNICVNLRGACRLMATQCELEKAKCKGQAWLPTDAIQCQNYIPNQWRWCACPRLLNCCNKIKPFCVRGPGGCKLMKTDCDLQFARCRGEVWTRTDDLLCAGFQLGQSVKYCSCPKLQTCKRKSSSAGTTEVCVRNEKGCKLLKDACEMERLLCSGEVWQSVDNLQCLNFPLHITRACRCPALDNCSNTTSVCGRGAGNQCYHFKSECDMRWAECEGEKLSLTLLKRCDGLMVDEHDECKCSESRNCDRQRQVCGRREDKCKVFPSECDFKKSNCQDENWQRISLGNCCQFNVNDVKTCTLNMSSTVCAQSSKNKCRLFISRCGFNKANANNEWSEVNRTHCKCISRGRSGPCAQRIVCEQTNNRSRRVCGRQRRTYRMFKSQCHLKLHNYEECANFREVRTRKCRRRAG